MLEVFLMQPVLPIILHVSVRLFSQNAGIVHSLSSPTPKSACSSTLVLIHTTLSTHCVIFKHFLKGAACWDQSMARFEPRPHGQKVNILTMCIHTHTQLTFWMRDWKLWALAYTLNTSFSVHMELGTETMYVHFI